MNVGSVCTREVIVVRETESLHAATQLMHDKRVGSVVVCEEAADRRVPIGMIRRAPVVTANGTLVGLVSLDDLLEVLVEQLSSIAHLIARQLKPVSQFPGGRTPPA